MFQFSRSIFSLLVLALLALYVGGATAKHHHKTNTHVNGTALDPHERLPSLCANGATVTRAAREKNQKSLLTCKYDRANAIEVFKAGFDVDGDGQFTIDECYKARRALVPSIISPFVETCEEIFEHCDCDNDRVITIPDFETAIDTCLRNCDTIIEFMERAGGQMSKEVRDLIVVRHFD